MLEAFDFVLFGAAGDLALRKLIPGLFRAHRNGELPEGTRIIPTLRKAQMVADYKTIVRDAAQEHLNKGEFDAEAWDKFATIIFPIFVDISTLDDKWAAMAELLNSGDNRQRVFISPLRHRYLASAANICTNQV